MDTATIAGGGVKTARSIRLSERHPQEASPGFPAAAGGAFFAAAFRPRAGETPGGGGDAAGLFGGAHGRLPFPYRNKTGLDVALKVLRESWCDRRFKLREVNRVAGLCRMGRGMKPCLEFRELMTGIENGGWRRPYGTGAAVVASRGNRMAERG